MILVVAGLSLVIDDVSVEILPTKSTIHRRIQRIVQQPYFILLVAHGKHVPYPDFICEAHCYRSGRKFDFCFQQHHQGVDIFLYSR